jgi:CBS domain-containing protein
MATLETLLVRDYMTAKLITFSPDMDVMSAVNKLVTQRITSAPIVDASGKMVGMFSERDCLNVVLIASADNSMGGPVSQYMSTDFKTVTPDTSLMQLANLFVSNSCRRYPVMDGGKLIGQISRSDVMRAINDNY